MAYKLYLFDFDYTLANSEEGIVLCFLHTFKHFGFSRKTREEITRTIGADMEDAVRALTPLKTSEEIVPFLTVYRAHADSHMTQNTHFYPNALKVLRTLHERGAKTGIISSKTRHRVQERFAWSNALDAIDIIIGREDVEIAKPDPTGMKKAIAAMHMHASDVLYTGDSIFDAETAKNAGVDFAAVLTGTTSEKEFHALPHRCICHDLEELLTL